MRNVSNISSEAKVYAELTITSLDPSGNDFLVITGGTVEGHDLRHMKQVNFVTNDFMFVTIASYTSVPVYRIKTIR